MTLGPVMLGIDGTTLTGEERQRLRHPAVGGVILFTRNFRDPAQVTALIEDIHDLRDPPLLVAVDQEGGRVQRFRQGLTELPPPRRYGEEYDHCAAAGVAATEQGAWLLAAELRALGVDLTFAPLLDLDRGISGVIGDRALHADPEVVTRLGLAWQRGVRRAGMAAVGKHYPGHGGVAPDSHVELPVDGRGLADLRAEDEVPFRRLIDNDLAGVMMAHVVYSAVDGTPAGFSRRWVSGELRGELGFQGAVFSDDLGMAAAAGAGDLGARALAALAAGCDMVLVCNEGRAADAVLAAVEGPRPASALRLARLRGRGGRESLEALRAQPAWQAAAHLLAELERGRSGELEV
ncbi:beta-N-acetylhexosaminidase [Sediminicurvatus halobius]|uniref:Beta-hexosaminidase n=1 Tax=Sediminicurvatus halobius TaxID=2182432 RepID=A0A2U2N1X4_9GAMM|nr:beta-N-acetylhexosaminidase [Spiribacter halobius]PWG63211.1 beta-N-acetylhexosaminidase [Spiribacter halobius]UEX76719.1 beta-N-acetylhexosaminidase [Spiribacter halobius]